MRVFLFLGFLLLSCVAQAQFSTFEITESGSTTPVYATISIYGPAVGADTIIGITDFDGKYQCPIPLNRPFTFSVRALGYQSVEQENALLDGTNSIVSVQLTPSNTILGTTTVTTSKFERKLSETTVSIDVLKPALLEAVNAGTPERAIDKLPGISMLDGQANIRGGSGWSYGAGSRVLLLLDEVPALQADAGISNWSDLPVENVEQIEVVKGAASALYGSSAMNGIIHLRTGFAKAKPETKVAIWQNGWMAPEDKKKNWWYHDSMPRPQENGIMASHKQKFGKLDVVASTFYQWEQSFRKETWARRGRLTTNLRYRFNDRLTAGLQVNYNNQQYQNALFWKNENEGAYLPTPLTAINVNTTTRYFIDPFVQYYTSNGDRHKLLGRLYSVNNKVSAGRSNANRYFYGEYQYTHTFDDKLFLTAGVVASGNAISAELYGDTTFFSRNYASYGQLVFTGIKKVTLEVGARLEQNILLRPEIVKGDTLAGGRQAEAQPVFRAGANYQVGKGSFLRGSWGQGYRYPTVAELFIETNAGFQILPNPKLKSEQGWTSEIGFKQVVKVGQWAGFADVSFFWSRYFDMLEFNVSNGSFAFQSRNIGNTDIKGAEISFIGGGLLGKIPVQTILGYTYIDPRFQNVEDQLNAFGTSKKNILKYRFQHVIKSDVQASFGKFDWGVSYNHNSEMVNIDAFFEFAIPGVKQYRANHSGFGLLETRLAYRITKQIKVTAQGLNLLNTEYSLRPAQLEAPRGYSLRFDWSL